MWIAAIALGLVLSVLSGERIARAHENAAPPSSVVVDGDVLDALTRGVLDQRLSLEERGRLAQARLERLGDLLVRDPAQALGRMLSRAERAALPDELRALVEDDESLDGTLQVLHADGPDGGAYYYNLETASGERLALHFADGQPDLLTGTHVRARGLRVQQALALGGAGGLSVLGAPVIPGTFGPRNTLIILIELKKPKDDFPQTAAQVDAIAFGATGSADQFIREVSYQQSSLTGRVVGPLEIAFNGAGCDYLGIGSLARAAASKAGVVLGQYNHLVYAMASSTCTWKGLGTLGGYPGEVWINGAVDAGVLTHELGHNLGLYHSHSLDCGAVAYGGSCSAAEYGDYFDAMGYGSAGARHYNAVQKELLGWLGYGASPPITEVTSSGVYTLDPYEPTGTGPKALKVRTAVGDWFYVEYRQPIGADSGLAGNPNVANGVLVHYWNGLANGVYLLDMTPATASWTDPALTVGSTFTDAAGRVSITPVWANGTNAGVNVNVGAGCVRKLPAVSVTPAQQTGGGGTPLTYSVSVRNNDTNCGTSTFNLSVVAPSGWATAIAGVPMVLGQGGTATATLQLTSSATAAPTTYSATITASGPTLSSTATASYVVTPPVSGGGGGGAPGSFADSFDRPDSAQLGNGWSVVSGSLRLEGGEALSDSGRDLHMAVQPGVTGATQAVGATFASSSSKGNPQFGVAVRYQSPSTYYRCYRVTGGVSAVRISKVVNGAETVLKSVSIKNPKKHASFALSCQASGTSLSLSIDGQRKVSVTDSSLSSGSVGFLMGYATVSGRSESHRADNFTATAQ